MELSEKLQALRKQKGLTQEELAAAVYVSRTAVSKWESGRGYPSIDSLKVLAKYFDVTIDELLSGDELLAVAETDNRQKLDHFCDLAFGLLDCSAALLFFLPLFGQKENGNVQAVSLLSLTGAAPYLRAAYGAAVIGMTVWGILTLALQNCRCALWVRNKRKGSAGFGIAGVFLFIISAQPYAASVLFAFLLLKGILLAKQR